MTEQTPAPAALAESQAPCWRHHGPVHPGSRQQSTDLKAARAGATAATNEAKSAALGLPTSTRTSPTSPPTSGSGVRAAGMPPPP